jgi:hypothetical protein
MFRIFAVALLFGLSSVPVLAQGNGYWPASSSDHQFAEVRKVLNGMREDEVRAVVAEWYSELKRGSDGFAFRLFAPMGIYDACNCDARADGTPVKHYVSPLKHALAYSALEFSYEIEELRVDNHFARVEVWERGWFYAWANREAYENAAGSTFILERDANGEWKIAAFTSRRSAVRPDHADDPMPDLSGKYDERFPEPRP